MNMDQNPTVEQLRSLLVSADDWAGNHVLWINHAGEVLLTRLTRVPAMPRPTWETPTIPGTIADADVRVFCEEFPAGLGYVGSELATDDAWTSGLFRVLIWAWIHSAANPSPQGIDLEEVLHPSLSLESR